ncbi:hypothetical protein [Alphaentomopoxvirus acuprea]|uniref:Uncharacterized protein n=1 Tax=Alphaentomopoxvirus acuprea TaxID=62099 RepID=W6JPM3_9POXV|nr:hypothetical protein BA82_gp169 [Anomala cuprea entomopoxvirus]BAO49529.1 hypothetical protein [Anomala cuprea entomopoxvirus]
MKYVINIIFIIGIIVLIIFIYNLYIYDINLLDKLTDDYFENMNTIPEPIFDFNPGNLNNLIDEYNNLDNIMNNLFNQLSVFKNNRNNLLILIEENNETIMNLRSAINELKEQISATNNFIRHIFI